MEKCILLYPVSSTLPTSVTNKMDGLPSFFDVEKKEVFVARIWTQRHPFALRATFQGVKYKTTTKKESQDAPPVH